MQIFGFIGNIFGYLLWFFYTFTKNYGIAIILFTIVIKLLMFPLSVKQQKSMAQNARMAGKQKELQEKYGKDKQKLQEEMAKLYEKEGVSPLSGCTTMIIPLLLLMGVYWAVVNPLKNTLHIDGASVDQAVKFLATIPGVGGSFNAYYGEIEIVNHFSQLRDHLSMFNAQDLGNIDLFSQGFNFLGLNLLLTPSGSAFTSFLWLIPVLCLVSSLGTQFITMRIQGNTAQMQGCMKVMMYGMPLFSAWIAYTVPAAVGFYWIISTMISFGQTVVLNKFYNANIMMAREEAARIVLREQEEAALKPILVYDTSKKLPIESEKPVKNTQRNPGSSSGKKGANKKKGSKQNAGDSYLGTSKTGSSPRKRDE